MAALSDTELKKMIEAIAHNSIPNDGKLTNPLTVKKQTKSRQIVLTDTEKFPIDITQWTNRTFVDYFANTYKDEFNIHYRKVYKSDGLIFQQILDFFKSNALDYKIRTKNFIDWAFKNKKEIIRTEGYFTPQEIFRKINMYYQEEILPDIETGKIERKFIDTTLIDELVKAENEGKITEIFCRFGIPIGVTYLVCYAKKIGEENLLTALKNRIELLYNEGEKSKIQLTRIFKQSIIRSPYPREFKCINWRNIFQTKDFEEESWWREQDYRGNVPNEYDIILNGSKGK